MICVDMNMNKSIVILVFIQIKKRESDAKCDPHLFCTSHKRHRFFLFSRRFQFLFFSSTN